MSAQDQIDSYRRRRLNLMQSADEIAADIKELDLEAKANGLNVAELKKWVTAEHKNKLDKRVSDVVDSVLIGEALGHNLGNVLNNESDEDLNGSED